MKDCVLRATGRNEDGSLIFPVIPPLIDLTKLCRDHKKISTVVVLFTQYHQSEWLLLGQIRLTKRSHQPTWELAAYLDNATDFEHDSAFCLKMNLVGVELTDLSYGMTTVTGWISAEDPNNFRVPDVGYDPRKHPKTTTCKQCKKDKDKHLMIPEGFYIPPENPELYEIVKGRRIEIHTGVRYPKEPE